MCVALHKMTTTTCQTDALQSSPWQFFSMEQGWYINVIENMALHKHPCQACKQLARVLNVNVGFLQIYKPSNFATPIPTFLINKNAAKN